MEKIKLLFKANEVKKKLKQLIQHLQNGSLLQMYEHHGKGTHNYQPIEDRKVTIYQRLKHTCTRKWSASIFVFWHLPIMAWLFSVILIWGIQGTHHWVAIAYPNSCCEWMIIVLIITIFLGRCHLSWPLAHLELWELPWWVLSSYQLLIMHITAKLLQDLR